jgi:protocatechuate 3,4-dioxygenase beta subunit
LSNNSPNFPLRRTLIKTLGTFAIAAPFLQLVGCGSASDSSMSETDPIAEPPTDTSIDEVGPWLSGGTTAMTVDFPDDSLFDTATACAVALTGAQIEGPCYFQTDYLDDISEEQTGLPMQLCLRLIDRDCIPLAGYEIEVWHCDVEGIYSGDSSNSPDAGRFSSRFCTGNDNDGLNARWFRGIQVTDSNGRVNFKSCFPGWYASRAIHVHFRIRNNNNDELISQFGFDDDFCDEICTNHVDYASQGIPDTHSTNDMVFRNDGEEYQFEVSQNSDGSLLAWKTIQIS